jgi:hypothetical protein
LKNTSTKHNKCVVNKKLEHVDDISFRELFSQNKIHTGASQENEKKLARFFNFTFRYIDDVLSLNNASFGDFVDRIYPIELEIKDTTEI